MPSKVFVKPYTRGGKLVKGYWRKLKPGDIITYMEGAFQRQATVKSITPNGAITTDNKIVQAKEITALKPPGSSALPQVVDRAKTLQDYKPSVVDIARQGTGAKGVSPIGQNVTQGQAQRALDAMAKNPQVRVLSGTANAKPYESHSQRLERLYKDVPTHENDPAAASKIELNALQKRHIEVTKQMEANLAKGDSISSADLDEFSRLTTESQDLAKRIREVKKYIKQWSGGTRNEGGQYPRGDGTFYDGGGYEGPSEADSAREMLNEMIAHGGNAGDFGAEISSVSTYSEAGVLTMNKGVRVTMADGSTLDFDIASNGADESAVESDLADWLSEIQYADPEDPIEPLPGVTDASTLADAGVLTMNDGLVLRMEDGTEVQVSHPGTYVPRNISSAYEPNGFNRNHRSLNRYQVEGELARAKDRLSAATEGGGLSNFIASRAERKRAQQEYDAWKGVADEFGISTANQKPISEMTTPQLIMTIRQIENSPRGHQPFSIVQQIDENLANLREELRSRGGTANTKVDVGSRVEIAHPDGAETKGNSSAGLYFPNRLHGRIATVVSGPKKDGGYIVRLDTPVPGYRGSGKDKNEFWVSADQLVPAQPDAFDRVGAGPRPGYDERMGFKSGTSNLFGGLSLTDEQLRTRSPKAMSPADFPRAISIAMGDGDLERVAALEAEMERVQQMYERENRDRTVRAFRNAGDRVGAAYAAAGFGENLAAISLSEEEIDNYLSVSLMAQTGGFSKGTANVSAHDVRKLKPLMRHYAKMAHPFTACVRDNRKRFGPGAEAVCAVLKDLIKGTTKWRKGGHKKAHLSEEFFLDPGDVFYTWLSTVTEDQIQEIIDSDVARGAIMHPHSTQVMAELFFSEDSAPVEDNGLIWKTVLREGQWKLSPGPGQKPQPKPITVVSNGRSDGKRLVISMEELMENFKTGAVEHVTVPTSHNDKVTENTGYVRDLRMSTDPQGRKTLVAGIEFTEPEIREKVKRGTIANISSGILFDYADKEQGKKFTAVLGHAALTNKPWLNGMPPFGVQASEAEGLQVLAFSEESNDPATTGGGETVSDGTDTLMDRLGLSEDEISARLADYDRLRKEDKERNIQDKCKAWETEGKAPAVITVARELMMGDSGEHVLNLSEEGTEAALTATDIVERLVNATPKLGLSQDPATDQDALGEKPKDDASDENEAANLSQDLKNEAAAIFLSGEVTSEEEALKLAKERRTAKTTES